MDLYIMRHAEARHAFEDSLRELTPAGWEDAQSRGADLAGLPARPQRILHSPYLRARQTGEAVCTTLGLPLEEVQALHPAASVDEVVDLVSTLQTPTLLISHLPLVELVCFELCGRSPNFQPATIAHIQLRHPKSHQNGLNLVPRLVPQAS
jgi:phosphohistidine phosphatase